MVIEFQIVRTRLEDLLHERIIAARPCITQPFQMLNEQYYVVSVDIGSTKLAISDTETSVSLNAILGGGNIGVPIIDTVSVTLNRLQLEQKVDVLISSETALKNANVQPPVVLHVTATIVFDLIVTVNDAGRPRLCARVAAIRDLDLADAATEAWLIATIQDDFENCANFGLGALAQMAGGATPVVVNAGIAATPNVSRVAIRFDTADNAAAAAASWASFFAGNFPSRLADKEWALVLPHELLIPPMLEQLEDQLKDAEKFTLKSGPGGTWAPLGTIPRMKVTFAGEIIDACVGIDVDVDVTVWVTFTVPAPDVLRVSLSVSWDGDFWEELACELLAATFWPIVGAMFLHEGKLKWWQFVLGFAGGPAAVFVATIVYLSTDEPASEIPDPPDWTKDSDTQWHQDTPFPTTFGNLATGLTLTSAGATSSGLLMAGTIDVVSPIAPTLAVGAGGFSGWSVERPCTEPFAYETFAKVAYWAEPMGPTPRLPLNVCNVQIVNDPLGQYTTLATVDKIAGALMSSASTTITLNGLSAAFVKDPYPLEVLVQSNNGARWVTIPPPPPIPAKPDTPEEWEEFQQAYIKWKAQHCWLTSSIWGLLGIFFPKWLIDPPQEEVYAQAWWLTAEGLAEGAAVTLRDRSGRELATARADRSGRAEVSAVLERARLGTGVMIARTGAAALTVEEWERRAASVPVPESEPQQALRVKQVLLVQLAAVTLDADARQIALRLDRGVPTLVADTEFGAVAYSLAEPRRPERVPADVMNIASAFADQRAGGHVIAKRSARSDALARAGDVLGRNLAGDHTYVLAAEELRVFDQSEREVTRLPFRAARGLALVRDRLAVVTEEGIVVWDLSQPQAPVEAGIHRMADAVAVRRAPVALAREAVYVSRLSGRGVVLDVADPRQPAVLAEHEDPPWYVEGSRLGRLFARLDAARRRVRIYRMAETAVGFERPPLASHIWRPRRTRNT